MFKGVSQCVPTVDILYFGPFNPFHYSPLSPIVMNFVGGRKRGSEERGSGRETKTHTHTEVERAR
jgi:hypothetical protein